jgi:hypothetical protein
MTRRLAAHPDWCGQSHVCSIERGGEHRSHPVSIDTEVGRVVLTRVQTRRGANRMEIRAVVELPAEAAAARVCASTVVERVCRATVVGQPRRGDR